MVNIDLKFIYNSANLNHSWWVRGGGRCEFLPFPLFSPSLIKCYMKLQSMLLKAFQRIFENISKFDSERLNRKFCLENRHWVNLPAGFSCENDRNWGYTCPFKICLGRKGKIYWILAFLQKKTHFFRDFRRNFERPWGGGGTHLRPPPLHLHVRQW